MSQTSEKEDEESPADNSVDDAPYNKPGHLSSAATQGILKTACEHSKMGKV